MRTLKKKIRSLLFALTLTAALILAFAVIGIAAPSKETEILTDFQSASDNYVMEGSTVAGSLGVNGFEVQGKSAMFEIAATNGKNKYL